MAHFTTLYRLLLLFPFLGLLAGCALQGPYQAQNYKETDPLYFSKEDRLAQNQRLSESNLQPEQKDKPADQQQAQNYGQPNYYIDEQETTTQNKNYHQSQKAYVEEDAAAAPPAEAEGNPNFSTSKAPQASQNTWLRSRGAPMMVTSGFGYYTPHYRPLRVNPYAVSTTYAVNSNMRFSVRSGYYNGFSGPSMGYGGGFSSSTYYDPWCDPFYRNDPWVGTYSSLSYTSNPYRYTPYYNAWSSPGYVYSQGYWNGAAAGNNTPSSSAAFSEPGSSSQAAPNYQRSGGSRGTYTGTQRSNNSSRQNATRSNDNNNYRHSRYRNSYQNSGNRNTSGGRSSYSSGSRSGQRNYSNSNRSGRSGSRNYKSGGSSRFNRGGSNRSSGSFRSGGRSGGGRSSGSSGRSGSRGGSSGGRSGRGPR